MIRGAKKQMIVVRTGNSRYFDEAYFVLRRGIEAERREESDILAEANRILCESGTLLPSEKKRRGRRLCLFLAGAAAGSFLSVGLCLLLLL